MRVYFWALFSIPLAHVSIMPVSYYFDYCSFVATSSRRQKERERTTSIPFPVASPGPETE